MLAPTDCASSVHVGPTINSAGSYVRAYMVRACVHSILCVRGMVRACIDGYRACRAPPITHLRADAQLCCHVKSKVRIRPIFRVKISLVRVANKCNSLRKLCQICCSASIYPPDPKVHRRHQAVLDRGKDALPIERCAPHLTSSCPNQPCSSTLRIKLQPGVRPFSILRF